MLKMKTMKQNKKSPIEKVSTLNPERKNLLYRVSPSHATNPVDFPYWGIIVYIIYAKSFGGFSLMSKIQVYTTTFQGYVYEQVTGTCHSLTVFMIYLRYRYLFSFAMRTYRCISILFPYNFCIKSIA